jgi:AcrR family transcriptional regulator
MGKKIAPARKARKPQRRSEIKRALILDTALRHFAERGYHGARVEDMASEMGIAKGSIFQHFKTKDGLFFAVYKKALTALPRYLDAPADVKSRGFFPLIRYWLDWARGLKNDEWMLYRIQLVGAYGTDLKLRREINRWLLAEDPIGTVELVRFGLQRDELRQDIDDRLLASIVDWMVERFEEAMVSEELDPGIIRSQDARPDRIDSIIEQFMAVLRSAIGRR